MLKNAPNEADNFTIFQSFLLPKMRLSVVLEGRYTDYNYLGTRQIVKYLWYEFITTSKRVWPYFCAPVSYQFFFQISTEERFVLFSFVSEKIIFRSAIYL